jgi:endonuclease G
MAKRKRKQKKRQGKHPSILIVVIALIVSFYLHQTIGKEGLPTIKHSIQQGGEAISHIITPKEEVPASPKIEIQQQSEEPLEIPQSREMDTRVMNRKGYALSFNDEWLMPNWVAWRLTPERLAGKVKRTDEFTEDINLPERLRVQHRDYSRSGYDRGHMVPAADMKWDEMAMRESFYMSNICPQAPNLNKGDWKELEEACRNWAQQHNTAVYIACGPIVHTNKKSKRIGKSNKITVPDGFFKVVMKLGKQPAAVGFIFPNDDCNAPLESYTVPVDSVEVLTDIDFFHLLPDNQENQLEATNGFKRF